MEEQTKAYSYFLSLYGKVTADRYRDFIKSTPTDYIRVNLQKITVDSLSNILKEKYKIETQRLPGFSNALKIASDENDLIGKTIEQILGLYYIQGLSSMLPPLALQPTSNDIVLDLCSAPGSKTTQMAEMMNNQGTLIVNEIEIDRIKSLVFNLDRMNVVNTGIIHSKGEILSKFYTNYFDKILVDAPCSGLGIIQKKEEVGKWWSMDHVRRLQDLQLKLLVAAIKMVKVGGEVVYSTCTLSVEENELILDKVLSKYPVELLDVNLPVRTQSAFVEYQGIKLNDQIKKAVRIFPWEIDSDGFFLVRMKKLEETEPLVPSNLHQKNIRIVDHNHKDILPYIEYLDDHFGIEKDVFANFKFIMKEKEIFIISSTWKESKLDLFHRIGIKLGTLDKKNRINFHSNSAQVFAPHIKDYHYKIKNEGELKDYLTGMKIRNADVPYGQYAVSYKGNMLGTAVNNSEGFKSRFPRTKRTQNFII